jgi:hypothetical protein
VSFALALGGQPEGRWLSRLLGHPQQSRHKLSSASLPLSGRLGQLITPSSVRRMAKEKHLKLHRGDPIVIAEDSSELPIEASSVSVGAIPCRPSNATCCRLPPTRYLAPPPAPYILDSPQFLSTRGHKACFCCLWLKPAAGCLV